MLPGMASLSGWRSPQASAGTPDNTREPARSGKKKPQLITVGALVLVEGTTTYRKSVSKPVTLVTP